MIICCLFLILSFAATVVTCCDLNKIMKYVGVCGWWVLVCMYVWVGMCVCMYVCRYVYMYGYAFRHALRYKAES